MTAVLLIGVVWLITLGLWVVLKLRQPKLVYPSPPASAATEQEAA